MKQEQITTKWISK